MSSLNFAEKKKKSVNIFLAQAKRGEAGRAGERESGTAPFHSQQMILDAVGILMWITESWCWWAKGA